MKKLLILAFAVSICGSALAADHAYRSNTQDPFSYGPVGPNGTLGQWPERGSQIILKPGTSRSLTEMTVPYLFNVSPGGGDPTGAEILTLRIYANDGAPIGGFPSPGTLLAQGTAKVHPGSVSARFVFNPPVTVPDTYTFTGQFSGGVLSIPPFDTTNVYIPGMQFRGTPEIGSTPNGNTGLVWKRRNSTDPWAPQTNPGGTYTAPVFSFGASVWTGGSPDVPFDTTDTDGTTLVTGGFGPNTAGAFSLALEGNNTNIATMNLGVAIDTDITTDQNVTFGFYEVNDKVSAITYSAPAYQYATPDFSKKIFEVTLQLAAGSTAGGYVAEDIPVGVVFPQNFVMYALAEDTTNPGGAGFLFSTPTDYTLFTYSGFSQNGFAQHDVPSNTWNWTFLFGSSPYPAVQPYLKMVGAAAGPRTIAPSSFTIFRGSLVSGGLAQLLNSDDQYLIVRNGPIAFPNESPITVYFDATDTGSTRTGLTFKIENKVSINGLTQIVDLFNYTSNSFDTTAVDTRPAPTTDTVVTITGTGTIGRFFNGSNGMRARLRVRPAGPLFTNNWRSSTDQVQWTVTP